MIGSVPLNCGESMEFPRNPDDMTGLRLTANRGGIGEGAWRPLRSFRSGQEPAPQEFAKAKIRYRRPSG